MERPPVKTLKVAICIPVYGKPHSQFMHSLVNMVIYSLSHATIERDGERLLLELDTFIVSCSMLTESRHKLVAEAMAWDADYMLCLDADHVFPHDTLLKLLSHGLPVVGCNYSRRVTPTAPTAAVSGSENRLLLYTTQEKADANKVEECAHLGFGVLLMDMRIFDVLQAHAEKEGDGNFLPLFVFEPTENKIGMIGEDVYFFSKLAKAGIKPFVDHALSWQVGHIFEMILTSNHAVQHKQAFEEGRKRNKEKYDLKIAELEAEAEREKVPANGK